MPKAVYEFVTDHSLINLQDLEIYVEDAII